MSFHMKIYLSQLQSILSCKSSEPDENVTRDIVMYNELS